MRAPSATPANPTIKFSDYYKPETHQLAFHDSMATYPLLEGGRGGGKSLALLWEAIYQCVIVPGANCLLLRRTLTASEKGGIEDHFLKYVPRRLYKNWNGQAHCATFWNGSKLFFGHIKADRDLAQYQSAEFLFIGWDELTQFTYSQWDYMRGSNRCPVKTDIYGQPVKPRMAGATNPNGVGHDWVKALWITHRPPQGYVIPDYRAEDYKTYHSTYSDNPVYRNDVNYINSLASIADPVLRLAWIPGDWNILAGAYFQNWEKDRHTRTKAEVTFEFYQDRWISIDWGYAHACVVLWWTRAKVLDGFGREKHVIVCYRELVVRRTNEAVLATKIAQHCGLAEEGGAPVRRDKTLTEFEDIKHIYLSPDRWNKQNEEHTIADRLGDSLREYGLPRPEKANNDRVGGWQLMSTLFDTEGVVVLDTCCDVIESIPKLQRDPKKLEDAIKEGNELYLDVCESFRYGVMSYATENAIPREFAIQERIRKIEDPTAKYMEYLRLTAKPAGVEGAVHLPSRAWKHRRRIQ